METNYILQADVLDLIFDKKNKSYGAYNLRKYYNQRLTQAMLFTALLITLFLVAMSFTNGKKVNNEPPPFEITTVLSQIKVDKKLEIIIPTIKVRTQKAKTTAFVPPVIKADKDVTKIVSEIKDNDNIGAETNLDGAENLIVGVAIDKVENLVDSIDLKAPPAIAKITVEDNAVYATVDQEASFPGGSNAWRKFLMRELDANRLTESGAAPGVYTVLVEFVVSKNGDLSDIHAVNSIGFGLDKEAMRAIKKGPRWIPARQGDVAVNAVRRQLISFVIPEE